MINRSYPMVTIAIPTYNRADSYLPQALQSALKQTYKNIEIIVSDNCSTDNTEMVIKGFDDPRIRYFRQKENIGANNNFNFCLKKANGKYFLLLQDDDLIDSDFIETCLKSVHHENDVGLIRTGLRIIDSDLNVKKQLFNMVSGPSIEDFVFSWFSDKTFPYLCSTLFNTARLRETGGFGSKHNLFQDVMAEFQLAAKFGRFDIQDIKASFRVHSGEMTFLARISDWCEDSLMLLSLLCGLVSDENKKLVRIKGMKFFSDRMYGMAMAIKSPVKRYIAYAKVFQKFNCRYIPPTVFSLFYKIYCRSGLRYIYKGMKS